MNKKILFVVVMILLVVLLVGCKQQTRYPTGYAAYPTAQQGGYAQPQHQGYIGGGCAVAPVDDVGAAAQPVSIAKAA